MRRALFLAALLVLGSTTQASAAWAFVTGQAVTDSGNDVVLTFAGNMTAGNQVIVFASLAVENQTISITDTTFSFAAVAGPVDSAGFTLRSYIFCGTVDATNDANLTVTTSGTAAATATAIEFSGGTCTLDGTVQSNDDSGDTSYALTTDVTVTGSNSLLLGLIRSDSSATFTEDASLTLAGELNTAAAAYRILVASGSFDVPWTSAANENVLLAGAALQAAAAGSTTCMRSLLGVGCN